LILGVAFALLTDLGSFDFTKAAEEDNAENLLIILDKKRASLYTKNWQEHPQYSEVYAGREK
jgi:hypothetical protein